MAVVAKPKRRIAVVDDKVDNRESMVDDFAGSAWEAIALPGPYLNVEQLKVDISKYTIDAALCDYHLTHGTYAAFNGAQLMQVFYQEKFPAVLQTGWSSADFLTLRKYRRYIPVLLKTDDANIDLVVQGIETCRNEHAGAYSPSRRPWRTLLRIEEVNFSSKVINVIVVGWSKSEVVPLEIDDLLLNSITPNARLYALVNAGAEHSSELYFYDFKLR